MKMNEIDANVAMAMALLYHLTQQDKGDRVDVELRQALRKYIEQHLED